MERFLRVSSRGTKIRSMMRLQQALRMCLQACAPECAAEGTLREGQSRREAVRSKRGGAMSVYRMEDARIKL